jgi:thiamine-monophosphate kinase
MTAGDDYELCFTCSRERVDSVQAKLAACGTQVTEIGVVESLPGLRVVGGSLPVGRSTAFGYRHF